MNLGAVHYYIYVAAWTVAVVFAVKISRHSSGRAERFLLIGTSMMLASSIVRCVWVVLYPWLMPKLVETRGDYTTFSLVSSAFDFGGAFIALGGIICLIYAFWHNFRNKQKPLMSD